ncbi:MAG TPA: biotin/lipoyl-containing protein, partial [Acidimicrobiia bacterium]
MIDFLLPSLGADMDQAKLNRWLVKPGDTVHKGQIIAEVETDKAVLEVECWDEGVVTELVMEPGPTKLEVGTVLARIDPTDGRVAAVTAVGSPRVATLVEEVVPWSPTPAAPSLPAPTLQGHVAPPVRHLAHQMGVSLDRVTGSGPGGEITRADV